MKSDFGVARFIIGFIVIAVLVLFAVILFTGGDKKGSTTASGDIDVTEYVTRNSMVRMTIDGPINGQDQHRQIRITISRNERLMEVVEGYQYDVFQKQSFENTPKAYEVFLHALAKQGFGNEREKAVNQDEAGTCANGRRYIFEILEGSEVKSRLWTTSCSKDQGTYMGGRQDSVKLFQNQITDYSKLVRGIKI